MVQVQSVETEQLPKSIKVYNLNVIGYHTYVVGEQELVVHNTCTNTDVEVCQKGRVANSTMPGQKHHAIGNKPWSELQNKSWGKGLNRNNYQMRALTKEGHKGYETWHRLLDQQVTEAVQKSKSLLAFERRLNKIYRSTELIGKFGKIKIIL